MPANTGTAELEAALAYASRGWHIFPVYEVLDEGQCSCRDPHCTDQGKHPRTRHGGKEATSDLAVIRAWWSRWPNANIGIATGSASGLIVLDVDPRHGGDASLEALEHRYGPLPRTPRSRTGGGGRHFYFQHPGGGAVIRNVTNLDGRRGLDVKADGGYVVAPPSRHKSGRRYAWAIPSHPEYLALAHAPSWLIDLAERGGAKRPPADRARRDADDWLRLLQGVAEGERHTVATQIAGHFLGIGRPPEEVEVLLLGFAGQCRPPHDPEDIRRIVRDFAAARETPSGRPEFGARTAPATEGTPSGPTPVTVRLSEVEPEEISWLWPQRIARGKVNLLVGDPGLGKSKVALDIAARITTRQRWPAGVSSAPGGHVVILTAEDGLADTVRPRIDALEGDPRRITVLQAVREANRERSFNLEQDVALLESVVQQTRAVLVIVDPVSAYLGRANSWKDAEIRGVLGPLAALAERTRVAVLGIMHLSKDAKRSALYRAQGSIAFVAAARAVFAVAKDPATEDRRFLVPIKMNIAAPPPVLAFHSFGQGLAWEWDPVVGVEADAILGEPRKQEEVSERGDAEAFLRELLAGGELPASDVFKAARANGIAERTLKRAKKQLGITTRKRGQPGKVSAWYWSLPSARGPK